MVELTNRERLILRSVINSFILNAAPIGSRTLAKQYNLGLSPATIRNTMADLEDMGLLEQPHTSAGRTPTNFGYRMYVDDLMRQGRLSSRVKETIERTVSDMSVDVKEILRRTSKALGRISNLLGVVMSPKSDEGLLQKIDLSSFSSSRIMVIIALKSGAAKTALLEVNFPVNEDELQQTSALLNQRLYGMQLKRIRSEVAEILRERPLDSAHQLIELIVDNAEPLFKFEEERDFFHTGLKTLLLQPEFTHRDRMRAVVELLENKKVLVHLVSGVQLEEGVRVTIGEENPVQESRELSVLSAAFSIGDDVGTLSVIGPTRMDYPRLWSVVDFTAKTIQKQLN